MSSELTSYDELADVLVALPLLVREQRRIHRLSLRAAAVEIGTSFSTLSRFEGGESVHSDVVHALLRWLARCGRTDGATPIAQPNAEEGRYPPVTG